MGEKTHPDEGMLEPVQPEPGEAPLETVKRRLKNLEGNRKITTISDKLKTREEIQKEEEVRKLKEKVEGVFDQDAHRNG